MNEVFTNLGETLTPILLPIILVTALIGLIVFIAKWRIYKKAGQPGWATLIPFYNTFVHIKVAKLPLWTFILALTPFIFILNIILWYETAKNFGKSNGYGVAINIFGIILIPALGFGKNQYNSENNEQINITTRVQEETINNYQSIQELNNNFIETQPTTQINTNKSMNIIPEQLINIDSPQENTETLPIETESPNIEKININNTIEEPITTNKEKTDANLFDVNFESNGNTENINSNSESTTTNIQQQQEEVSNSFELPKNESIDDLLSTIDSASNNNNENVESLFATDKDINEDNELNINNITPDVIIPTNNTEIVEDKEQNYHDFDLPKTESIDDLLSTIDSASNDNNEEKVSENISEFDIQDLSNNNEFDYNSANDQINNLNIPINEENNTEQSESMESTNEIIEDIIPNVVMPTSDIILEEDNTNEVNTAITDLNISLPSDVIEENNDKNNSDENEIIKDITPDVVIPTSDIILEEDNTNNIDNSTTDFNIELPTNIVEKNNDKNSKEDEPSIVIEPSIENTTAVKHQNAESTKSTNNDEINIIEDINNESIINTNDILIEENDTENNDENNSDESNPSTIIEQINENETMKDIIPNVVMPTSDIILEEDNTNEVNTAITDLNISLPSDVIEENNDKNSSDESNSSTIIEQINENETMKDIIPNVVMPTFDIILEEDNTNNIDNSTTDFNIELPTNIVEENNDDNSKEDEPSIVIEPNKEDIIVENSDKNINNSILDLNIPTLDESSNNQQSTEDTITNNNSEILTFSMPVTDEANVNNNILNAEMIIPSLEEAIELPIIGENSFENSINIEELKENTSDINAPKEKFNIDDLLATPEGENNITEEINTSSNLTNSTIIHDEVEDGFKTCNNCGTKNIADAPLCFLCGKAFE